MRTNSTASKRKPWDIVFRWPAHPPAPIKRVASAVGVLVPEARMRRPSRVMAAMLKTDVPHNGARRSDRIQSIANEARHVAGDREGEGGLSLLPAGLYLGIQQIEAEVRTPTLLARRFILNPVLVIISVVFWFWMWGAPGAILSMPMLAITKIICDRVRPLAALGHFLEG